MRPIALLLCAVAGVAVGKEQATASHILMKDEDELKKVMEEIEGGDDFAKMARIHSTCPSKDKGGDLGTFGRGAMVKEFDAVIFDKETEVGKVYGPVKTQFGFHAIMVTERGGEGKKSAKKKKKTKGKKSGWLTLASEEDFTNKVLKSKEVAAIEFYSKMCGSCTEFAPIWDAYTAATPPFKTIKLSIDDPWVKTLATRLGVMDEGIPNVRIFPSSTEPGVSVVKGETPNLKQLTKQLKTAAKASGLKKGKKTGIYKKASGSDEEL